GRILLSGCFRVEFRDFFIADELNSLAYSFWTLSYFFCAYSWQWLNLDINCNISLVWYTPLIASLPPWWRLLQCLRRYKDSDEMVHLANALKYLSSVVATITAGIHRMHLANTATNIIWALSLVINASYTSTWDIKMDWGLLQPSSKHPFLRDDLVFPPGVSDFYYISVIVDIVLRFAWILNFINLRIHKDVLTFVLALMEAYRRIQWNVFRLENEHLNNCGQYRAIKEIPLPFALSSKPIDHAESTAEEGRQNPTTTIPTSAMPIPIGGGDRGDRAPTPHTGRDSVYGSFYGRRDFESRHDMEENKETAAIPSSIGALENVLTRIRSFGNNVGPDESDDDDDIDRDDDDDEENLDSSDGGDRCRSSHNHHAHVL
ncbi:EXS family-domain-containing protein, partial [Dichotomocladium elegans]